MANDDFTRFVRAWVRDDHLHASAAIEPGLDPAQLLPSLVESLLRERGVNAAALDRPAIAALVEEYRADPSARAERVVASGQPPQDGRDAEFRVAPELEARPAESADTGQVDHHARTALKVVSHGQVLGVFVPPTPGQDGIDVGGRTLAARAGRGLRAKFDESVDVRPDGTVVAQSAGLLEVTPTRIRVVQELRIAGAVDFSTGNIDFPGDVLVSRGVRDCFVVRAGRDLRVDGLVEAADLASGRDAHLVTGMAGREKGVLHVGRDLKANYLTNLQARIGRDAEIHKEVANCHLIVQGALRSPVCAIVGGAVCVARRADVAQVGAESATATELVVGRLPDLEAQIAQLLELRPQVERMVERAQGRLAELHRAVGKLTPSQAEELTELEFELAQARTREEKVAHAAARFAGLLSERTEHVLSVHRALYPGARVWIGAYEIEVREFLKGPIEIFLSPAGVPKARPAGGHSDIDLSKFARVMQQPRFLDLRSIAAAA